MLARYLFSNHGDKRKFSLIFPYETKSTKFDKAPEGLTLLS